MKKRILTLILSVIIIAQLSACGTETAGTAVIEPALQNAADEIAAPAPGTPAPAEPLSGKLTVAEEYSFYYLNEAAAKFKQLHPDVDIEVVTYDNSDQLAVDLMAGTAPDLFSSAAFSKNDFSKQTETGMITDLKPFIENDPDFTDDNYFMNVLEGMQYQGGVYSFPLNFIYEMIGINETLPGNVLAEFRGKTGISTREMLDIYQGLSDKTDFYLTSNFDVTSLSNDLSGAYIDLENKTCDFNQPDLIKLVEDAKAATNLELAAVAGQDPGPFTPAKDEEDSKKYAFRMIAMGYYEYFLGFDEYFYQDFIPLVDNQGTLMMIPFKELSINANAQNKDLAWAFLKFLTTEEANEDLYQMGYALNRAVYDKALTKEMNDYITYASEELGIAPAGDPAEAVAAAKEKFDRFADMPMRYMSSPYKGILNENLQLFQDGAITAEQLAAELQNKISIALME